MNLKGKTALVTGASSGLGSSFAKQLAAMGADLVITARRADRLEKLAAEIAARHGVKVAVITLDLGAPDAARRLFEKTEGAGIAIDVLVNNAGFACYGAFTETPLERIESLIAVDVLALTGLTHLFARAMLARGQGWVLNVASFAAYMPVPNYAAYAAAKAYVRNFSEAVAHELRDTGVRVMSLCPGGVATEFWEVAGQAEPPAVMKMLMDTPDEVARIGLGALFRGRRNIVAGILNALGAWSTRLGPRRFVVRIAAALTGTTKALPKP